MQPGIENKLYWHIKTFRAKDLLPLYIGKPKPSVNIRVERKLETVSAKR